MIDRADIQVKAGDGGHGLISFHREKYVTRGGPDGGDGGRGGDVILEGNRGVNGLGQFRFTRLHKAERGINGGKKKMHGRNGADLILRVPPGTIARTETGEVLGELTAEGDRLTIAHGGKGGRGNQHFATPSNQAPHMSETGQRGEDLRIELELRLISDVGLVGLPNAGKSTLLAAVSRATPKIADYPFTTLEPVLGVVEVGFDSYVMADIPGLIEGAHEGHGLGLDFLRHIERTRLLIHIVDAAQPDPARDVAVIDNELRSYADGALAQRPQIIAFNKMDVPEAEARRDEFTALAARLGRTCVFLSAAARIGTPELVKLAFERLERLREDEPVPAQDSELTVLRPEQRGPRFRIEHMDGAWRVVGEQPVLLVEMLALQSDESRAETMRRLGRMGVVNALRRAGVVEGDPVRFGDVELRWEE